MFFELNFRFLCALNAKIQERIIFQIRLFLTIYEVVITRDFKKLQFLLS